MQIHPQTRYRWSAAARRGFSVNQNLHDLRKSTFGDSFISFTPFTSLASFVS
jgi:hypothetical protein